MPVKLPSHYVETKRQPLEMRLGPRGVPCLHLPDGTPLAGQVAVTLEYRSDNFPRLIVEFAIDGENVRHG